MSQRAQGAFAVTLVPQPLEDTGDGARLGRLTIDKTYHGDLEATAVGEMLSARTDVDGSAAYVALERVTGSLGGKTGSFVLQHTGTMTRGESHLSVTVVPDSGTGELVGLTGALAIHIEDGKHSYDFEYALPE